MIYLSIIGFILVFIPLAYLLLLMLAAFRSPRRWVNTYQEPYHRFAIAIPAHDEVNVIGATVRGLLDLEYPQDLFSVHIVADHCSDNTASIARQSGAQVHERYDGPRSGKGAALAWLFSQILQDDTCDAVVVFDADTRVDPSFLRVMNNRLLEGHLAIQGQHIISNPDDGWYPSLIWAMFLVDNRLQNLGRTNLGWSAKNMGDSIGIRADVLHQIGWGQGLTEDYQLRQRLLLQGIKVFYEPAAKGFGEAAYSWGQARAQRARWLRGTNDSSQQFRRRLLAEGIKRRDLALLDGAMQAFFPSYSTLTMIAVAALVSQLLVNWWIGPFFPSAIIAAWSAIVVLLFIYPLIGLALEKAPLKAYLVILSGPLFIAWRTWLALAARLSRRSVKWVRTAHGREGS